MKFILTCSNGKQIDMSSYVLKQMEGKITRKQVELRLDMTRRLLTISLFSM